ncbi:MAG TPA: Gfo/Idh/MocA family oxidoreductase, partial [Chitinophagaceae bacterium]
MNRKNFLRTTALATAALGLPALPAFAVNDDRKVRIALIGTGLRGQNHLELMLRRTDVDIVAICDVDARMLGMAKDIVSKSNKKMPQVYTGDNDAWKNLLEKEKLDAVLIATPWEWHCPMVLGALDA